MCRSFLCSNLKQIALMWLDLISWRQLASCKHILKLPQNYLELFRSFSMDLKWRLMRDVLVRWIKNFVRFSGIFIFISGSYGLLLLSSWNILHGDITLNSSTLNGTRIEIYLQNWDEWGQIFTTATSLMTSRRWKHF